MFLSKVLENDTFFSRSALKIQLVTSTSNFAEKPAKHLNLGKIHRKDLLREILSRPTVANNSKRSDFAMSSS